MTHICVVELTIIGLDNGLSPGRRQAIIWTNAGILLIGPLGTNFIEILVGVQTFSFKKMHLKMSSAKWRPFCPGLNVLRWVQLLTHTLNPILAKVTPVSKRCHSLYLLSGWISYWKFSRNPKAARLMLKCSVCHGIWQLDGQQAKPT